MRSGNSLSQQGTWNDAVIGCHGKRWTKFQWSDLLPPVSSVFVFGRLTWQFLPISAVKSEKQCQFETDHVTIPVNEHSLNSESNFSVHELDYFRKTPNSTCLWYHQINGIQPLQTAPSHIHKAEISGSRAVTKHSTRQNPNLNILLMSVSQHKLLWPTDPHC